MFQRRSERGLQSPHIPTQLSALYLQGSEYVLECGRACRCRLTALLLLRDESARACVCVLLAVERCDQNSGVFRIFISSRIALLDFKNVSQCGPVYACSMSHTSQMCKHISVIATPPPSTHTYTLPIPQPLFSSITVSPCKVASIAGRLVIRSCDEPFITHSCSVISACITHLPD